MMKATNKLYWLLLVVMLHSCDTVRVVDPVFENNFIKYYGTEGDQAGVDLVVNDDGTMIMLGNSIFPASDTSAFLMKVDSHGKILWSRHCGGNAESFVDETAVDVEVIRKGPYQGSLIVVTNVGSKFSSQIRLTRIGQDGKGIDSVLVPLHPGGKWQRARGITPLETADGYAVTGSSDGALTFDNQIQNSDREDILAWRFNESLTFVESIIEQGGEHVGTGVKVFEALIDNTPTYAVFGYSDRPINDQFKYYSLEVITSRNGIQTSGQPYGTDTEDQTAAAVIKTPGSIGEGFFMAGTSSTVGSATSDLYLAKFSRDLKVTSLLQKIPLTIAGAPVRVETVAAAVAEPTSFYILANQLRDASTRDIFLVKVRYDGGMEWESPKTFGTSAGDDTGGAVASLPDGRIAVLGTMESKTKKKMALILLSAQGNLSN